MRNEIQTNLLGKTAIEREGLEHCWKLNSDTGEIVAVWLDSDNIVMIQVVAPDGTNEEMWLRHVLVSDPKN